MSLWAPPISDNMDIIPIGTILWFTKDVPPEDYLECDGSQLSIVTYNKLYNKLHTNFGGNNTAWTPNFLTDNAFSPGHGLNNGDTIILSGEPGSTVPTGLQYHTLYSVLKIDANNFQICIYGTLTPIDFLDNGTGNQYWATQFAIPDLRGEFIRGWDHGKGTDPGRVFASNQADAVGSHFHPCPDSSLGVYVSPGRFATTLTAHIGTSYTTSAGGPENRPKNIAILPCIKYI